MGVWTLVHDRVVRGEMPPADADQPSEAGRHQFQVLLAGRLTEAHRARREVVLRRLNRVEYENTVRRLFGIEVFVHEMLPEDASAHGFDNIGAALSISTEQMQAYLETADSVLDTVFGSEQAPKRISSTLNLRDIIKEDGGTKTVRITEDGVVLFNSGYNPSVLRSLSTPGPGLYRVRIQAKAVQTDKPVTMLIYGGVWGRRDKHVIGFFDIPPGEMTAVEFTDRQWERGDTFEIYPFDTVHRQTDPDSATRPGLFVGDVTVERRSSCGLRTAGRICSAPRIRKPARSRTRSGSCASGCPGHSGVRLATMSLADPRVSPIGARGGEAIRERVALWLERDALFAGVSVPRRTWGGIPVGSRTGLATVLFLMELDARCRAVQAGG